MKKRHYDKFWKDTFLQRKVCRKLSFIENFLMGLPNYPQFYELIENRIPGCRDKIVLDIGCGEGALLSRIASAKMRIGLDVSEMPLKGIKDPSIILVRASACSLPFKKASLDVIFCSEVIEHLYDPKALLYQVIHCLRKDGFLFVTTPLKNRFMALARKLPFNVKYVIAKIISLPTHQLERQRETGLYDHPSEFYEIDFKAVLEECGFEVVRYKKIVKNTLVGTQVVLARKSDATLS